MLPVTNAGWEIAEVKQDDPSASVTQAMRGYKVGGWLPAAVLTADCLLGKVLKHETRSILAESEQKVIDEA
eukprot:746353-Hanusia_phi.AAC.6